MGTKIFIAALAMTMSGLAFSEGYVGLGFGETDIDTDISDFEKADGIEVYAGFSVSDAFDIEVAYVDFGDADDNIPPNWNISGDTISVSAKGNISVNEKFQLFGRLGLHSWNAELKEDGFGSLAKDDGNDLLIGVGALFNVSDNFGIGARFTKYDLDDDEIDHLSLNLQINY